MIHAIDSIDIAEILESYHQLESNMSWTDYGTKGRQAGLQYRDIEDPRNSAVGKSRGEELAYTNLNPFFSNTVF